MRTLALAAAALVAWMLISRLVDLARPLPEAAPQAMAMPDAVQTRIAVLQQVPLQTPLADAARSMAATGFRCEAVAAAHYVDASEPPGGEAERGPADVLRCDPGGHDGVFPRRWRVVFEASGGRVSRVGVAVP